MQHKRHKKLTSPDGNLESIPIPAPLVTLLPLRFLQRVEPIHTLHQIVASSLGADNLVPLAAIPLHVLSAEEVHQCDRGEEADADVREDDTVTERVPRFVLGAILKS